MVYFKIFTNYLTASFRPLKRNRLCRSVKYQIVRKQQVKQFQLCWMILIFKKITHIYTLQWYLYEGIVKRKEQIFCARSSIPFSIIVIVMIFTRLGAHPFNTANGEDYEKNCSVIKHVKSWHRNKMRKCVLLHTYLYN
jgi:hypothetical protein